jgi:hypothetical protein
MTNRQPVREEACSFDIVPHAGLAVWEIEQRMIATVARAMDKPLSSSPSRIPRRQSGTREPVRSSSLRACLPLRVRSLLTQRLTHPSSFGRKGGNGSRPQLGELAVADEERRADR